METNDLDEEKIEKLFHDMDGFLRTQNIKKNFIVIGSTVIIRLKMPFRATMDVDFYSNPEEDKEILQEISSAVGIDFDPDDYQYPEKPYIQWVNPDFVHMPLTDTWKKDLEIVWSGEYLKIYSPPIGVLLGSKLAASRDKDFIDSKYLVDLFPNWREEVAKYKILFSEKDQQEIEDNIILMDLHLASRSDDINPSMTNSQFGQSKKIK